MSLMQILLICKASKSRVMRSTMILVANQSSIWKRKWSATAKDFRMLSSLTAVTNGCNISFQLFNQSTITYFWGTGKKILSETFKRARSIQHTFKHLPPKCDIFHDRLQQKPKLHTSYKRVIWGYLFTFCHLLYFTLLRTNSVIVLCLTWSDISLVFDLGQRW